MSPPPRYDGGDAHVCAPPDLERFDGIGILVELPETVQHRISERRHSTICYNLVSQKRERRTLLT